MPQTKTGKKHRKFGRWSRAPSMKMYKAVDRLQINKARRKARHLKAVAKKVARKSKKADFPPVAMTVD